MTPSMTRIPQWELTIQGCIVAALGIVTVAIAQPSQGDAPSGADIVWHGSYTEARALAESSGKPLLVQFR